MEKLAKRYVESLRIQKEHYDEELPIPKPPTNSDRFDISLLDSSIRLKFSIVAEAGETLELANPTCEFSRVVKAGEDTSFEGRRLRIRSIESAKNIYEFTSKHRGEKISIVVNGETIARPVLNETVDNGAFLIEFGSVSEINLLETLLFDF